MWSGPGDNESCVPERDKGWTGAVVILERSVHTTLGGPVKTFSPRICQQGAIQVRYSTKLGSGKRSKKSLRL